MRLRRVLRGFFFSPVLGAMLLLGLVCFSTASFAQSRTISVYGVQLYCNDSIGRPVPFYVDDFAAQSYGGAFAVPDSPTGPAIVVSLSTLRNVPPLSAFMIVFHECGHVALPIGIGAGSPNQELNADCFAIREMRRFGLINNMRDFEEAVAYVSSFHGQGPYRRQNAFNCLN